MTCRDGWTWKWRAPAAGGFVCGLAEAIAELSGNGCRPGIAEHAGRAAVLFFVHDMDDGGWLGLARSVANLTCFADLSVPALCT